MYRLLRKKLGTSVSPLELPEHYQISKWINMPKHNEEVITDIISYIEADLQIDFDIPLVEIDPEVPDLVLEEPEITSYDKLLLEKKKTDYVLFGFGKTEVESIKYAVIEGKGSQNIEELLEVDSKGIKELELPYLKDIPKLFRADGTLKIPDHKEIELLKPSSQIEEVELLHPSSETINVELLQPSSEIENIELLEPTSQTKDIELPKVETISEDIEFSVFETSYAKVKFESEEVEPETESVEYQIDIEDSMNVDFAYTGIKISSVVFQYKLEDTIDIDFQVAEPEIVDHLAKLIPEVYKIDLLSLDDINPAEILDEELQKDYEILDKPPKMLKISSDSYNVEITDSSDYSKIMNADNTDILAFTNDLSLTYPETNEFSLSINELESDSTFVTEDIIEENEENADYKFYKRLIEPSLKVDELIKSKIFSRHYPYQRIGSEFLAECEFALLTDEFGLGKTIEAVGAINLLWTRRTIQTCLVITNEIGVGDEGFNVETHSMDGWIGKFKQYAPRLISTDIKSIDDVDKFKSASNAIVITFELLYKLIQDELLSRKILQSFDCIVFDEIHEELEESSNIENLISSGISPYYIWMLSSIPEDFVQQKIKTLFNRDDLFLLGRSKAIVKNELPKVINKDCWLELDEKQKSEYETKFQKQNEELSDILFLGDPFRFQANVFRTLQDLQQITNFAGDEEESAKTKLLIKQLKMISHWEKKAIVFTQFEKHGAIKIEKQLNKNEIKYVKLTPTMSPDELNETIAKYDEDDSMLVYLCSIKIAGLKFKLPDVSYIINFDQWWNPATGWSLEKKITAEKRREAITVVNYFIKNTFDQNLYAYFNINCLTDKNLVGHLSTENYQKMINEDDWTQILQLTPPDSKESDEPKVEATKELTSIDELTQKMSFILTFLGYTVSGMETGLQNYSSYIHAEREDGHQKDNMMVKCIHTDFINSEAIQFHLKDNKFGGTINKIVFVTSGKIEESFINTVSNTTVLDATALSSFLKRFGI